MAWVDVQYRTTSAASVAFPSWHGGGLSSSLLSNAESSGAKSVQAALLSLRRA